MIYLFGRKKISPKADFTSKKIRPNENSLNLKLLKLRLKEIDRDEASEIGKRKAILEDIEFSQLSDETLISIIDDVKKIGTGQSSDRIAYELRIIREQRMKELR